MKAYNYNDAAPFHPDNGLIAMLHKMLADNAHLKIEGMQITTTKAGKKRLLQAMRCENESPGRWNPIEYNQFAGIDLKIIENGPAPDRYTLHYDWIIGTVIPAGWIHDDRRREFVYSQVAYSEFHTESDVKEVLEAHTGLSTMPRGITATEISVTERDRQYRQDAMRRHFKSMTGKIFTGTVDDSILEDLIPRGPAGPVVPLPNMDAQSMETIKNACSGDIVAIPDIEGIQEIEIGTPGAPEYKKFIAYDPNSGRPMISSAADERRAFEAMMESESDSFFDDREALDEILEKTNRKPSARGYEKHEGSVFGGVTEDALRMMKAQQRLANGESPDEIVRDSKSGKYAVRGLDEEYSKDSKARKPMSTLAKAMIRIAATAIVTSLLGYAFQYFVSYEEAVAWFTKLFT